MVGKISRPEIISITQNRAESEKTKTQKVLTERKHKFQRIQH